MLVDRVLLVSGSEKGTQNFSELLKECGYMPSDILRTAADTRRKMIETDYDIVVINTPLADEFGADLAIHITEITDSGVIMLVKNEVADSVQEKVENFGIFVISKPLNRQFFTGAQICHRFPPQGKGP
jgi:response regulator NasT